MGHLPTGTITFLFTDIEGSTKLWENHPDAMKPALVRHDVLLREAIEGRGGYVFKTVGDAFCAAFAEPGDALEAAITAQRSLHAEPWDAAIGAIRIRAALHTGAAEERDGDYFGQPLNRVARLLSAGHGGQTLISLATKELIQDKLPHDATLQDMGERRLKDLIRPERVFQVLVDGMPTEFPPLKTLDSFRHNLPIQLTSFVGREKEIGDLRQMLSDKHLITLIGPGGTGKTRLSLQVAAEMLEAYPDGVWMVELAPITDPDLVALTVLSALGLREEPDRSPIKIASDFLQEKHSLVVFDNCEHLVEASARVVDELLRACPNLTIITSSREALGIAGEAPYRVPSLSAPDPRNLPPLEALAQYDSIRLFIDRAVTAAPGFAITAENAPALAQICHRLDGIPLAIELAAARVSMLKAEQIAARLDDSFRLLTGGSRTALPRQQTLRALIDWSYNLLEENERKLLMRLSVFTGGWTLEAAEGVCAGETIDVLDVLDVLAQLVSKSLVTVENETGSNTRYRLLETIRQYARDRLLEAGAIETARNRHFEYFLQFSKQARERIFSFNPQDWAVRLLAEIDNLRAALEWSLDHDPYKGLMLTNDLGMTWANFDLQEGTDWLERVLQATADPDPVEDDVARQQAALRARALIGYCNGQMLRGQDLNEAIIQELVHAERLARQSGDKAVLAQVLTGIAFFYWGNQMSTQRIDALEEAMALHRELGDTYSLCRDLIIMAAMAAVGRRDEAASQAYLDETRQIIQRNGSDPNSLMFLHMTQGRLANFLQNYPSARENFEKALDLIGRIVPHNSRMYHIVRSELAHLARRTGQLDEARDTYCETIRYWLDFNHQGAVAHQLECCAFIAIEKGQFEQAARMLGAAGALRRAVNSIMARHEQAEYAGYMEKLQAALDQTALESLLAEGQAMSPTAAVRFMLEKRLP